MSVSKVPRALQSLSLEIPRCSELRTVPSVLLEVSSLILHAQLVQIFGQQHCDPAGALPVSAFLPDPMPSGDPGARRRSEVQSRDLPPQ